VLMSKKGKPVLDTELVFQKDDVKQQGDYRVTIDRLGQWSELHLSRRRHMQPIIFGAIVAACGLLLRLVVRPRRVWLDEAEEGSCRVRSVGVMTL
jgi:cytochrome c biogenesis protein ResB